ncbi:MAG: zinc ribbon domain-containing protein [Desulfobacterales bacterium]|nr:zinc ribbon domain-containing protein [Desulfobacterales bacterium]
MPTVEYQCPQCDHRFSRVALRGEAEPPAKCPNCGAVDVTAFRGASSLFDGIANFSDLAKDTN